MLYLASSNQPLHSSKFNEIMKKITILFAIIISIPAFSADRVVEEFGFPPAYSSIGAAVAAAEDGDRIIIKNRAGNIPWIENITIDKSLQFLSYSNDDFFVVQGNYTISFITDLEVTIVGMRNTSGSILQGSAASGNRAAKVSIIDSWFQDGLISLSSNFFDVQVIGNKIDDGRIVISIGNIIGNEVSGTNTGNSLVRISNSTPTFLGDTCLIVGNRFDYTASTSGDYTLSVRNDQQVVHIKNNYIRYSTWGIDINNGISEPIANQIWNNTFRGESSFFTSTSYGIRVFNTGNNSIWEIMNNAFVVGSLGVSNRRGVSISSPGGDVNVYYNHFSSGYTNPIISGGTFVDLNEFNQTIELNVTDGSFNNAPDVIDGGNPAPLFYDLDLSPNDPGCWGGSYTHQNFFPLHTGAARVYHVKYPFNVRQGNTMNVKAFSFDR